MFLTPQGDLDVAFDKSIRLADSAKTHNVEPATAALCRRVVAKASRDMVHDHVSKWLSYAKAFPPVRVIHIRKFDEARTKLRTNLSLPGIGDLEGAQVTMPFSIMQHRRIWYMCLGKQER